MNACPFKSDVPQNSHDRSEAAKRARSSRGRLRELLTNRTAISKSTWNAPPASYRAVPTFDALPESIEETTSEAWLVPTYELAEALVERGADSSRIAVAREPGLEQEWIDALVAAGPSDPILPPRPQRFPWRCLVVIPTYNEAANLTDMIDAVTRFCEVDILVVDDGSPDGTGRIADQLASERDNVFVLHRAEKQGLGPAYVAGFGWALERDYERIFEMDCDFSHAPWDLPRLAAASTEAELVIGSRYVRGGATLGWTLPRRLLSRGANFYTKIFLGRRVRDWTAGFRCFHADQLRKLPLDQLSASGYSFQIEMAWRTLASGGRIKEVPISFVDRNEGKSKMSRAIAFEAVRLVPKLRWRR